MDHFFTPVQGKEAILKNWTESKLTYKEASSIPNITGVAVVLGVSNLVTLDLDDLAWCIDTFSKVGIDITTLLANQFNITSPKANRGKAVFRLPANTPLEYMKFPAGSKDTKLELRCGNRYDVWVGSTHPEGGKYGHSGNKEIQELPLELLEFWLACMSYKSEEKRVTGGTGEVPLIDNHGKMSIIHIFNTTHPLEQILVECGYVQRGNKWRSPNSTSGSYGLTTQPSYLNPWDVCYSHHESDGDLAGRPIDAFEIAASFSYPEKTVTNAKLIFTHDQANKLKAINPTTGENLPTSVHLFNNPTGEVERVFKEPTKKEVPVFPADIMETWPEPWPLIWKEWCKMPRVLSSELLLPAVLGVHAHMLGGDFITAYGRKPGFYFLTIAPSTAHKDGNSRDAIQAMSEALTRKGGANLFFSQILRYPTSITADTSFIEAFREDGATKGHLFWLNTEATRMFQKMNSSGNDNVAALADKIIEVVDGKSITGKQKADKGSKSIENPNVQLLFYTQPETIEKYITEELVDSGLLGRATITISPLKVQRTQMFIEPTFNKSDEVDDSLADFYSRITGEQSPTRVLFSDHGQLGIMQEFHNDVLMPMDTDDAMYKMISRLGNTAEQLFATIVGVCHKWDDFKGEERRKLPAEGMLPLIKYWADVKKYVIENYVHDELDPLAASILEVIKELVSGKLTLTSKVPYKIWLEHGMIPKSAIVARVKDRPKLKAKLAATNDARNISQRIYQLIDLLIHDGTLVEDKSTFGKTPYIGVVKM